jgi:hypothetical protein
MYGGIPVYLNTSLISDLCTRCAVSFTLWLLYLHLPSDTRRKLAGPQDWFQYCEEERNLLLLLRIEP